MPTSTMARKLCIAVSVFFGVLAVAILALWVRSYWQTIFLQQNILGNRVVTMYSYRGSATFNIIQADLEWMAQFGSDIAALRDVNVFVRPTKDATFAFDAEYFPTSFVIRVPHWFMAILCAAMATLPWLTYRYRLRSLLIATTLIAVVLGLVAWAAR